MIKTLPSVFLIVLGSAILFKAVIATVMSNLSTGIVLTYVLGGILIFGGVRYSTLPTWLIVSGAVLLLGLLSCMTALYLYGKQDTVTYREDVVLVLGAAIKGDKPTKSLQNRLDRAIDYHQQNPDAYILVSGGKGSQETISEAEAMARYLLAHGVPAASIIKEEAATSTTENFRFSLPLMKEADVIAFITTDYHIFRAAQNAADFSIDVTHAHAPTPWYMILPSGLRECASLLKYWLL